MNQQLINYITVGLFLFVILSQWVAYKVGKERLSKERKIKMGTVEAAIFGLLGFLIALTFAGAYSRYEARSQMVVTEANSISTAFLRLDILPDETKVPLQAKFVEYIDSRMRLYDSLNDSNTAWMEFRHLEKLQENIWNLVVQACMKTGDSSARILLLPVMNEMIDVMHSHVVMMLTHTSAWIFYLFILILLVCAVLSGMTMLNSGRFSWLYAGVFSFVTVITLYMIFDLEYPRHGLIDLEFAQAFIRDLKPMMLEHINQP